MGQTLNGKSTDPEVLGYCVHCRTRRTMQGTIQVCNRRGKHDLKGFCAVCGKPMYRLGGWNTVRGIKPPIRPKPTPPRRPPEFLRTPKSRRISF